MRSVGNEYNTTYNNFRNVQYKINNNFNVKLRKSNINIIKKKPVYEISLKDNLKLIYSNFVHRSRDFFKNTKIFWNKLNKDYDLEDKYNDIKDKTSNFFTNNIGNKFNLIGNTTSKLLSGLNNLWDNLRDNFTKNTRENNKNLKRRVKVIKTIKTNNIGYDQDNINKFSELTKQISSKQDINTISNNTKNSLFKQAKLNEAPSDIVKKKVIEARYNLSKYHSCRQADKSTFRELAVASFLEAFKLQTMKLHKDIKIKDFYSIFDMAKTNTTKVPKNREIVNLAGFKVNSGVNSSEIKDYLKWLVGDNSNNISRFNLDVRNPTQKVYHEYQSGPFCQTACFNNYLGYNFFHPSLALLLTSKNLNVMDINTEVPPITTYNKEEVHNKLIKLLIQSAKNWGFDIELLKPIINKLDIETMILKEANRDRGDFKKNLNDLNAKIRKNNIQDLFLVLGETKNLHIISMKKSKNSDGRWILLDGNREPFEVNFNEFMRYLEISSPHAVVHYSKKNIYDNINEHINKSTMPDIITKNMNSQIEQNYERNNIYINALNYIDRKIIQNIGDKEVISSMLNKEDSIINSELLPQTFVSSIKSFISMTNLFGENIRGNISKTNNSIKNIENYLNNKNIVGNINTNRKELTKISGFLDNLANIEYLTPKKLVNSISSILPADIHSKLSNILNEYFNKEYSNYKSNNWGTLDQNINNKGFSEIFDAFTFKKLNKIRENLDINYLKKTKQFGKLMPLMYNDNIDIKKSSEMIKGFIQDIKTPTNKIDDINKNTDVEGHINGLLDNIYQHKDDYNFKKSISLFSIKVNMLLSLFNNKEILDSFFNKEVYKKVYYSDKRLSSYVLLNPNEKVKVVEDTIRYCIITQLLTDVSDEKIKSSFIQSKEQLLKLTESDQQLLAILITTINDHHKENNLYIQPFSYSIVNKF